MVVVWGFCVEGRRGIPLRLASLAASPLRFAKGEGMARLGLEILEVAVVSLPRSWVLCLAR